MNRIGSTVIALALAAYAHGQEINITSFRGNGEIKWTSIDPNLFYSVQWSPSLANGGSWQTDYTSLVDIRTTSPTGTAFVPMFFRIVGSTNRTFFPAPVPRTMLVIDSTYDDGYHSRGVDWPEPRFTIGTGTSANCVTDNLTGLMWLRNPDTTKRGWWTALSHCADLDGSDGRGGYTDWRLPNIREMSSLLDYRYKSPALGNAAGTGQWVSGDPFSNVQTSGSYWTSTTARYPDANSAWGFLMTSGGTTGLNKFTGLFYTWPVRGGVK